MKRIPLLQLQQNFSKAIKSGANYFASNCNLEIKYQPPLADSERLSIYKNAYQQRILESFAEDFPHIKQVLNENIFSEVVFMYLKENPSNYWSLAEVGKNFSEYMANSSWGVEYPYLPDLAKLEWLKILSSLAIQEEPFDVSHIKNIPEDKQKDIYLKLHGSVYLLKSNWALHEIDLTKFPLKEDSFYIIYQKEGSVFQKNVTEIQFNLLKKISENLPIGEITTNLTDVREDEMTEWFFKWVSESIISKVYLKDIIHEYATDL